MIYYKPLVCFEDIESKISLYISHGGNGSIYQAMSQPVPLIVIPAFFEQEWNAHRVKKLNLGQVIFPGEMDDEIFTAIHRAISERVPEISETIQKRISSQNLSGIIQNAVHDWFENTRL